MTNISDNSGRKPWSTPRLKSIKAGSAESKKGSGIADGGAGGNNKS
ncbi:MAG: hypothetical protein H0W65_00840 [Sphingomonas sp.]|nr:hypothetical protein [Sphingomonas sp.]MBA3666257.1 hypothetical protein [Sphingomonas sp.]